MSLKPDDRCAFKPKHQGPNTFPNFPYWPRLIRLAHKDLLAVRDIKFGYTATYQQLVTDVLHFRNIVNSRLSQKTRSRLDQGDEVCVILLGPGGYEFTIAFLAMMALGVVIVPISPDLPVKEANYFATKSRSVGVVSAGPCWKLAEDLQKSMLSSQNDFHLIEISPHLMRPPLPLENILISSDPYFDMNAAGLVIFTSGTTGPPKGAAKRRGFFLDVATMFGEQYDVREGDVVLHILPVHHSTGITLTLLPFLFQGGTIEFRSGGLDVEWTWERIRQGNLDFFSGVPTIYTRLLHYYESKLSKLPSSSEYINGARGIRSMLCGTSALPRPLQDKWTKLRDGRPILTRYGLTEGGNAFFVTPWMKNVPDGSVGIKMAGIDVKLSSYPEGEILIRSPMMFSKYLFDIEATNKSIDEDGYFRTGDIARRDGDFYFIQGRASVDILKSGGYKISALDIEREILGLDYVSEVMVVGVEDEEFGQRVAAAIVLKPDTKVLTLEKLRADLRQSLAGYKMPTLLRVIPELKRTVTGKVIKKLLVKEIFPSQDHPGVQKWKGKASSKI